MVMETILVIYQERRCTVYTAVGNEMIEEGDSLRGYILRLQCINI